MSWSAARQRLASRLQEIERARRLAAEARLADARAEADGARRACEEARASLDRAESDWAGHLSSGRIDLELGRSVAAELMHKDSEVMLRQHGLEAATSELDAQTESWRMAEARVRSGEQALGKGRRKLAKQAELRDDQRLAERTTWKWFAK